MYGRNRRFIELDNNEIEKYTKHADKLEKLQRHRFAVSDDPFNFFDSPFEQEIRDEIAGHRETVKRQLAYKKEQEQHTCCEHD